MTKTIKKTTDMPPGRGSRHPSNMGQNKKDNETIYWIYFFIFLAISLVLLYLFQY
jgi:hypothetical protein